MRPILEGYAVSNEISASVRQRLLNQAHEQGRPFQELLQYFVMERFLYRLSNHSSVTPSF